MLVAFILLLFIGGIAMTQAVSDPHAVTLRWLRLGGIIAVTFAAVALTILLITAEQRVVAIIVAVIVLLAMLVAQLFAVQLGKHTAQRCLASVIVTGIVASITAGLLLNPTADSVVARNLLVSGAIALPSVAASATLLGGCLMTMLLGHAYLTAGGEMTQQPFMRLVRMLVIAMIVRATMAMFAGFLPWYRAASEYGFGDPQLSWQAVMACARLLVGFVVSAVLLYMVRDCVRRRANQSATGILYVLAVTLIVGEGIAMMLVRSTGWAF
jgi:hypothetical protein